MIKISAGIAIIFDKKILMVHSTNSPWWKSYTPPKGGVEDGESLEETASREVHEEIGIRIDPHFLKERIDIEYKTPTGKLYKLVHLFVHKIDDLSEINLDSIHLPFSMLQLQEVDEAKFLNLEETKKKILPRYLPHIISFLR